MSHMEEERSGGSGIDINKISLRRLEVSNIDDFMVLVSDLKMPCLCAWEAYDNKEKGLDYIKNIDTKHPWFKTIYLDNRPIGVIFATLNLGNDWCNGELGYILGSKYCDPGCEVGGWSNIQRVDTFGET